MRIEEPSWKLLLNYGAVIMFLTLPLLVLVLQIIALHWPTFLNKDLPAEQFAFLKEFQRALAVLVFGLAGLKTWQEVSNHKNGKK